MSTKNRKKAAAKAEEKKAAPAAKSEKPVASEPKKAAHVPRRFAKANPTKPKYKCLRHREAAEKAGK